MRNAGGRGPLAAVLLALVAWPAPAQDMPYNVMSDWQFYNNTGWQALNRGRYDRAGSAFRIAIDKLRPYEATQKALLARSYADYAKVLAAQQRYDEAEPLARWALSVRDATPNTKPEVLSQNLDLLARIEQARRKHAEAEALLKRLVALQERSLGTGHPDLIATFEALAGAYADQGKVAQAEPYFLRALALRDETSAATLKQVESLETSAAVIRQLNNTSGLAMPVSQNARAEAIQVRARTLKETTAESIGTAKAAEDYAAMLRRAGRAGEADSLEARAKAIRDAVETKAAR